MRKIITTLNSDSDPLFILVKSLSKSEKRQFKLYVGRLGGNTDSKFMALFEALDKMKIYDEPAIIKKGIVTKSQVSNLKAHLYRQLLISLRLTPSHQNIRVQIREQLDFATILYQKGLYKQSLKILDKAKSMAIENEEKNVAYEIVELEKVIETQYITRSIATRADELSKQSKQLSKANNITSKLSNLSLELYGMMLRTGYVKSDAERIEVQEFFSKEMPDCNINELGFRERLWLYKAHLWYSFLIQDFLACYKYSERWVRLFDDHPHMIKRNPVFYLKGMHYLLESLYYLKLNSKFKKVLEKLENLKDDDVFAKADNLQTLLFLYTSSNKFNHRFMIGDFADFEPLVEEVLEGIKSPKYRIDAHHVMVFYYKIASLYFGAENHVKCIEYLAKIINAKSLKTREDLMCFSRLLNLIAHYEAGKDYHLESLLRSTYKFLLKMNDLHGVQREMIAFVKGLGDIYPSELKMAFKTLHTKLSAYEDDPYERRAFLYLDVLSWLESKIENRPVAEVIQGKAKKLIR
jgi:tetratricopeptide (TPR) repeat protein